MDFLIVMLKVSPLYLGAYFFLTGAVIPAAICLALFAGFVTMSTKRLIRDMKKVQKEYDKWYRSLPFWRRREMEEQARFNLRLLQVGALLAGASVLGTSGEEIIQAEVEASQAIIDKLNGRT